MRVSMFSNSISKMLVSFVAALLLLAPCLAAAQSTAVPVTVTEAGGGKGVDLAAHFMGLSYETSMLLPTNGRYYFDAGDQAR